MYVAVAGKLRESDPNFDHHVFYYGTDNSNLFFLVV